ncbi:MAG: DUF1800 domain-containing protein [Planctomycetota bacterium]
MLEPFVPTADDPWDAARAAHLARRAGFGVPPDEVRVLVDLGTEAAVDRFVDFPDEDEALEEELAALGGDLVDYMTASGASARCAAIRRAWLYRLVHGNDPLREKLALLWHDHFAVEETKVVRAPMLDDYVRTLRGLGAGDFRVLVGAIARDPAMLHYLDNRVSTGEAPNENWGRELVELFTLGVDRYSQDDVVALARIFTGWTTPARNKNEFVFDPALHDADDKVLFGERVEGRDGPEGIREGEEALDAIVAREDCARFVAWKLLTWFADHDPPADVVDGLAAVLRENDMEVREGLRALFRSRWFLDRDRPFTMIRNPVELVVAHARAIGLQNADRAGIDAAARRMGMDLLQPPSVAGWDHGDAWTGPSTAAARLDVALRLAELPHAARRVVGRAAIDLERLIDPARDERGRLDHGRLVDVALARVVRQSGTFERELDDERRDALVEFLGGVAERMGPDADERKRERAVARAAFHLVLSLPEAAVA